MPPHCTGYQMLWIQVKRVLLKESPEQSHPLQHCTALHCTEQQQYGPKPTNTHTTHIPTHPKLSQTQVLATWQLRTTTKFSSATKLGQARRPLLFCCGLHIAAVQNSNDEKKGVIKWQQMRGPSSPSWMTEAPPRKQKRFGSEREKLKSTSKGPKDSLSLSHSLSLSLWVLSLSSSPTIYKEHTDGMSLICLQTNIVKLLKLEK